MPLSTLCGYHKFNFQHVAKSISTALSLFCFKFQKCPPIEILVNEVGSELDESFEFTQRVKTYCIVYHCVFICLLVCFSANKR